MRFVFMVTSFRGAYLIPTTRGSTIDLVGGPDTPTSIDAANSKIRALRCHTQSISIARVVAALASAGAVARNAIRITFLCFRIALFHSLRIRADY